MGNYSSWSERILLIISGFLDMETFKNAITVIGKGGNNIKLNYRYKNCYFLNI